MISNPKRGLDIDYRDVKSKFGASSEQETLITGRYRVQEVRDITEPSTNPDYGYTVKAYYLKEV